MAKYSQHYSSKKTSQAHPIPGEEHKMAKNLAGGYSYKLDKWSHLDRFLILGSEGNTYYATEREMTLANAKNILKCIKEDGIRVVNRAIEISEGGRAPRNNEALFVLAIVASHGSNAEKRHALGDGLQRVARIPTHLFTFLSMTLDMRGLGGHQIQRGIRNWYSSKEVSQLAYLMVKYRQRGGWTHRDALRIGRPNARMEDRNFVYGWATGAIEYLGHHEDDMPSAWLKTEKDRNGNVVNQYHVPLPESAKIIKGFELIQRAQNVKDVVRLIGDYNLPWEAIPTQFLREPDVWMTMLPTMPATALIRNLNRMTSIGLISRFSEAEKIVIQKLSDKEWLHKSRIHPFKVLLASSVYDAGRGAPRYDKNGRLISGSEMTWTPTQGISNALEAAFYVCFKNAPSTGQRTGLFLDVSSSMNGGYVAGSFLNPRQASTALALVTLNAEPNYVVAGFSDGNSMRFGYGRRDQYVELMTLNFKPRMTIREATRITDCLPFCGTDCALPMLWATRNNVVLDTFIIYTDNETWAGSIHPSQALRNYRSQFNPNAKLIVVGMTSTGFTIADPDDPGMLDIVGFDANAPEIMADFVTH